MEVLWFVAIYFFEVPHQCPARFVVKRVNPLEAPSLLLPTCGIEPQTY
jgi:hypothetical protein